MTPKKSLGQNFLMHQATAERIADAANLTREDTVLEIGPGTGMLTKALLSRAKRVVAVEADHTLVEKLKETFGKELGEGTLELIQGDIRAFDPASLPEGYALVANIPYYLTGEIMRTFLSASHKPRSVTVLVQKEVAERIARDKKGSLLSISVKTYGAPVYRFTVPKGAFIPKPKIDSAVLSIEDIHNPFASQKEEERFFEVLKTGFAHKRKLLSGNLGSLADKNSLGEAFQRASIAPKARAEDLSLSEWRALAKNIPI